MGAIPGILDGLKVVDLAGPYGQYCGKLLADLGANVVKVEPVAGDTGRQLGPFKGDQPEPEASLFFAYYNTNKRSLAMDLASDRGQEVLERLAAWADAIVETDNALDYERLKAINSRLILASISAFGTSGPYAKLEATPRSVFALSGIMKTVGPPEGPPAAGPGQLPFDLAAADAASGIVCAVLARETSGVGQKVTVSALEVLAAQVNPRPREQYVAKRYDRVYNPTLAPGGTYACADGGVELTVILPAHWEGVKALIGNPPEVAGPEWNERRYREEHAELLGELIGQAFANRKQAELVAEAQRAHVPCGPVNTVASFAADPQVAARGFFLDTSSPTLGPHKIPGAPYKFDGGGWSLRRPAPRLGEHTVEILTGDLGYSREEVDRLIAGAESSRQPHAAASHRMLATSPTGGPGAGSTQVAAPLAGVRVVTFTTAFAGPTAARYLADLGAEVLKVESRRRWDNTRHASSAGIGSLVEPSGAPTAPGFGYFNRNTLGVCIDLSQDKGLALMRRLIEQSDVVLENFSFQVLRKWGFDYEHLKQIKPDVILLDMQGMGQTGPLKDYVSFGPTLHSYSGLTSLWGYSHSSFVDYVAAQHAVFAVLSALYHRRQTGQGAHIDLAQLESAAATLGVPYLDYFVNGTVQRHGDARMQRDAPFGCYPCQGEDAWCVVEVTADNHWRNLRTALGSPAWSADARFDTTAGRLAARVELDEHVTRWTRGRTADDAASILQAAGVTAAPVKAAWEVFDDPHLNATGFYWDVDHPVMGTWKYPGLSIHLSDSPAPPHRPAPMLGQHNDYVFGELLGLSEREIAELTREGVLN